LRTVIFALLSPCLTFFSTASLHARDAFVFLSGGGTEMDNNYSQYLQARAMAAFFERAYPHKSVWTFFGAGNVEGANPVFSDVYREVKRDGVLIDTWLPGALPRNHPATREVFLSALQKEILPTVADGGTLYLFVGDHGTRGRGRNAESLIVLWAMYHDDMAEHGWSESEQETLGVAELRHLLAGGIGKGRVVFCMTQCFAGGFHYLAIPHDMTPETSWFTDVPGWARRKPPAQSPLHAAGYTATDEFTPAAGCDPSPDPAAWAGYERYLPENLLGMNLFTLEPNGHKTDSFGDAHTAAAFVDHTIDKPRSTSEQYLERWATLIETRLMRESDLKPVVKKAIADYNLTVNGHLPSLADPAFKERETAFKHVIDGMAEHADYPTLVSGTRAELEETSNTEPTSLMEPTGPAPRRGGGGRRGTRRLWTSTVRPAWKAAVEANQATNLPVAAADFEKYLLDEEDRGVNFFFGTGDDIREDVYWQAGYGDPRTVDTNRAEAISLWGLKRRDQILAWATNSTDAAVRSGAQRLALMFPQPPTDASDMMGDMDKTEQKETAAERTLLYRRVLAAWQFLLEVNDRSALTQLRELTDLERTPLPRPK
jgi:hypothetical protein